MVALQILVLSVKVRILVSQPKQRGGRKTAFFNRRGPVKAMLSNRSPSIEKQDVRRTSVVALSCPRGSGKRIARSGILALSCPRGSGKRMCERSEQILVPPRSGILAPVPKIPVVFNIGQKNGTISGRS